MSRYDGLIIPRSYSEYINKTDAATLQQALQLSGVLSGAVAAGDNKAVKSSAVNSALSNYYNMQSVDAKLNDYVPIKRKFINPDSNDWGLVKDQVLTLNELIQLLEDKGFLATQNDSAYRRAILAFRYAYAAQIYLQYSSAQRLSLMGAVIEIESLYDGGSNWLGYRKITINGISWIANYTMAGWSIYNKTN